MLCCVADSGRMGLGDLEHQTASEECVSSEPPLTAERCEKRICDMNARLGVTGLASFQKLQRQKEWGQLPRS